MREREREREISDKGESVKIAKDSRMEKPVKIVERESERGSVRLFDR